MNFLKRTLKPRKSSSISPWTVFSSKFPTKAVYGGSVGKGFVPPPPPRLPPALTIKKNINNKPKK